MNARLFAATFLIFLVCASHTLGQTAGEAESETRTWTDASGTFTVEAELVGFDAKKEMVQLKRTNGKTIFISLDKLSEADQEFIRQQSGDSGDAGPATVPLSKLSGKPQELKVDDGTPAGKKSFPRGIAMGFDTPGSACSLTSVRIHGGRYGYPKPPAEDFHVSLCDKDFKLIADFPFSYKKVPYGTPDWVSLRVKPTKVPSQFVICLNFNPTRTKGVFVSHDAEGKSLVGLRDKPAGQFTGGDWMVRVTVDQLK